MKTSQMKLRFAIPAFALTLLPAHAVIVAGANGGGDTANNTTAAQFQSEYGIPLPIYGNVIPYSDASGIYLGYNASTRDVWVISARHVTANASAGASVSIDGLSYDRQADGDGFGYLIGGDLRIIRYRRADLAVPSLPAIPLATTIPVANTSLVMIGHGQNRTENASTGAFTSDATSTVAGTGYHWSGTRIKRWGVNQVEAEYPDALETGTPVTGTLGTFSMGPYTSTGFITDFDQPGLGQWLSSNEGQGSLGDSGGGSFLRSGGEWYLSGVFSSVAGFGGQAGSTSAFGNLSILTDVSTYHEAIQAQIGATLVPEPGSLVLLSLGGVLMLRRTRRRG